MEVNLTSVLYWWVLLGGSLVCVARSYVKYVNCSYLPSMRAFLQIRTIKKWKIAMHNMALVTYAKAKVVEDRVSHRGAYAKSLEDYYVFQNYNQK